MPDNQFPLSPEVQQTLLTYSVLAALTPLIPIPLVDDLAKTHFRRQMVRAVGAHYNTEFAPHAVPLLADEKGGSCLGVLGTIVLYPLKKIFRKIFFFLEWKRAIDTVGATFYHGFLLACALQNERVAPRGPHAPAQVRAAIDELLLQTNTSPFNALVRGVFSQSKSALRGAVAGLQNLLRPLAGKPTPGRVEETLQSAEAQENAQLSGVVARLQSALNELPAAHFRQLEKELLTRL
jgi:hypothetical protein